MQQNKGEVLIQLQKHSLNPVINYLMISFKSFSIFLILVVMYFMLGHSDSQIIALLVLIVAAIIFSAAFISALVKDRVQRRKTSQHTVFDS